MTTVAMLDAVVVAMACWWVTLCVAILFERFRFDRRERLLAGVRERLTHAEGSELESYATRVTQAEFHQLVLDGLPAHVETAVARALLSRDRHHAISRSARGTTREDVWARIRAAQILASARAGVAHFALDQMMRSGNRTLASAALRLLVRLDDHRSAELMVAALLDGVHARSRIAAAFNAMSVERSDALQPLFSSDEATCRYWTARLTFFTRARQWVPEVRGLTADPDRFVRRAAVEALGAIGTTNDGAAIVRLFSDPAPVVRAYAARATSGFPEARRSPALRRLLADSAWVVRSAASDALGSAPPTRNDDTAAA